MSCFRRGVVIFLVLYSVHFTSGYKWITLKSNESIPQRAIKLSDTPTRYVGRANHLNLVLLAEVYNTTYAIVLFEKNKIVKHQFEILTATEHCEWTSSSNLNESVVRGGSTWNGEPTYIGRSTSKNVTNIMTILLGSNRSETWEPSSITQAVLICADNSTWVSASPDNVPKGKVYCGEWLGFWDYYVARLLGSYSYIPGAFIPDLNITSATHGEYSLESFHSEVLINDQYKWVRMKGIQIPDYAVIGGRHESGEMRYITRGNQSYVVHSEIIPYGVRVEYLVKSVG